MEIVMNMLSNTKTDYYKIYHKHIKPEYRTDFYIASSLSLEDMNKYIFVLQLIHAKLPTDLLADDSIDNEHIKDCWMLIRPQDEVLQATDKVISGNEIELCDNWERGLSKGLESLAVELDKKYHLSRVMLEVDKNIFTGRYLNSPFYNNPNIDKAKAIDSVFESKDVSGMGNILNGDAYVNFG